MQGFNLEELALGHQQFPIREEVFTMDADPCSHLDFIVSIHLTRKFLACLDIKRGLFARIAVRGDAASYDAHLLQGAS